MSKSKPKANVRLPPKTKTETEPSQEAVATFVGDRPAPSPAKAAGPGTEGGVGGKGIVTLKSGERRRRVNFLLPPDLVKELRHLCAERNLDMTEATISALERFLQEAKVKA